MIDEKYKIRAGKSRFHPFSDIIELAYFEYGDKDVLACATSLMMEQFKENELRPSFLSISIEQAQLLMDDLWMAGIRPTEGAGSAGAMKAVQNHLEDMRRLVFKGFTDSQMKVR